MSACPNCGREACPTLAEDSRSSPAIYGAARLDCERAKSADLTAKIVAFESECRSLYVRLAADGVEALEARITAVRQERDDWHAIADRASAQGEGYLSSANMERRISTTLKEALAAERARADAAVSDWSAGFHGEPVRPSDWYARGLAAAGFKRAFDAAEHRADLLAGQVGTLREALKDLLDVAFDGLTQAETEKVERDIALSAVDGPDVGALVEAARTTTPGDTNG